jgi:hypothetical protein
LMIRRSSPQAGIQERLSSGFLGSILPFNSHKDRVYMIQPPSDRPT